MVPLPTCDSAGASDDSARSYTWRAILALAFCSCSTGWPCRWRRCSCLPSLELRLIHQLHAAGAGLPVWRRRHRLGIVPRRSKWEALPLITEREQLRLFAVIREVADAMGPGLDEGYPSIPEVNAFVMQRGGFFGIGGKARSWAVAACRCLPFPGQPPARHRGPRVWSLPRRRDAPRIDHPRHPLGDGAHLVNLHKSGAAVHWPFEWDAQSIPHHPRPLP